MSKKLKNTNLRTLAGLPCNPVLQQSNWCAKDLADFDGEGNVMLLITPQDKYQMLNAWGALPLTESASTAPFVLNSITTSFKFTPTFTYDTPQLTDPTTLIEYLFPNITGVPKGMAFQAAIATFPNQIGMAEAKNGVLYETVDVTIPFSSRAVHKDIVQYLMTGQWIALKLDATGSRINVYGGRVGMDMEKDTVYNMMFSGQNDEKGQISVKLQLEKTGTGLEFIVPGTATTNVPGDLSVLFDTIRTALCMPNVTNEDLDSRFLKSEVEFKEAEMKKEVSLAMKGK